MPALPAPCAVKVCTPGSNLSQFWKPVVAANIGAAISSTPVFLACAIACVKFSAASVVKFPAFRKLSISCSDDLTASSMAFPVSPILRATFFMPLDICCN